MYPFVPVLVSCSLSPILQNPPAYNLLGPGHGTCRPRYPFLTSCQLSLPESPNRSFSSRSFSSIMLSTMPIKIDCCSPSWAAKPFHLIPGEGPSEVRTEDRQRLLTLVLSSTSYVAVSIFLSMCTKKHMCAVSVGTAQCTQLHVKVQFRANMYWRKRPVNACASWMDTGNWFSHPRHLLISDKILLVHAHSSIHASCRSFLVTSWRWSPNRRYVQKFPAPKTVYNLK